MDDFFCQHSWAFRSERDWYGSSRKVLNYDFDSFVDFANSWSKYGAFRRSSLVTEVEKGCQYSICIFKICVSWPSAITIGVADSINNYTADLVWVHRRKVLAQDRPIALWDTKKVSHRGHWEEIRSSQSPSIAICLALVSQQCAAYQSRH